MNWPAVASRFLAGARGPIYPPRFRGFRATRYQDEQDKKRVERRYLKYAGVGMQYGIAIALFTVGGWWLDGRFPSLKPLFTLLGFGIGFVGGTVSLIYQVRETERDSKRDRKE